jgi:glycolate oxidase FAD binding subunit
MTFLPEAHEALEEFMRQAVADKTSLHIAGTGTKEKLGDMVTADASLSLAHLSGIVDYQPEELIMVAKPGTRMDEVTAALAEKKQILAFEPANLSLLYGAEHGGSVGGIIAANLSGPRRISAGAARDYLLGFTAVSGRGTSFTSGSRVMKNVTGYDLSKLICGSMGTLAVMSELTLKVLPRPETSTTLSVKCAALAPAQKALSAAFKSATEPSGGAITHARSGALSLGDEPAAAHVRLEGVAQSVADRTSTLCDVLAEFGKVSVLEQDTSEALWQDIRDIRILDEAAEQVWKLSVTPSHVSEVITAITAQTVIRFFCDWAGGLILLSGAGEGLHQIVRSAVEAHGGGHASLLRAPDTMRGAIASFHPQPTPLAGLHDRIRQSFDPLHLLNPGKMGSVSHDA